MDRQRRNVTIPNRDASNEEKESKSYGLEYARYIEFEWITGERLHQPEEEVRGTGGAS